MRYRFISEVNMIVGIIIGLLLLIGIDYLISSKMESIAALKGHGTEVHAFAMCFWLGIIGYIYVAALPDKIQQAQNQKIIELLENKENEKV